MLPIHILLLYSSLALQMAFGIGQITPVELLKDPQTMPSKNGTYMMGFFSPPNTTKRYLGIWYNKVSPTYHVWVANRNKPLIDSSGVFRLSKDGNLEVLDGRNNSLWSVNVSLPAPNSTRNIEFLDSGNLRLVDSYSNVRNSTGSSVLWQSFNNPTDSLLPGMRITMQSSNMIRLYSWESLSDPSNGSFSLGLDSSTHPQLVLWNGNQRHYRSGPWNGNIFLGMLYTDASTDYADTSIQNNDAAGQVTLVYTGANQLALSHYYFSYDGYLNEIWWDSGKSAWQTLYRAPDVDCDFYGKCGAFGTCNTKKSPICRCLKGFVPKNSIEWNRGNWSSGCVRRTTLQCGSKGGEPDGFSVMKTVKLPDLEVWLAGLSPIDCRSQCLNNCSCLAYAYDAGAGCMYWSTQLIDIQEFTSGGIDLFLRLAHSELGNNNNDKVIIAAAVIGGTGLIALVSILLWMRLNRRKANAARRKMILNNLKHRDDRSQRKLEDLPLYDFKVLVAATKNFDESQKLGEGGFGQVYKGRFENGQEIAVKRLSTTSGQGMEEFTNEVVVISRLQHKNLVSLLGFCVEGEEKLLVYEYMPNKSLSAFLFDSTKREVLDWTKRFNIVEGICRGLIYLHRDSRLRIIHRDLKGSNILLDEQLNPKIADFGMARIFGHGQDQDETRRVVGTYGYMAPEYAMGGHFSEKSDVYSFGVLLLEIVTAKRNITFWFEEESLTLLGYVWKLWAEDNVHSIIDPVISDPLKWKEINRFIQVGLLCVQENVKDRPSMSTVLSMLSSEIADLPSPKRPAFNIRQMFMDTQSSQLHNISQDNISLTTISGR